MPADTHTLPPRYRDPEPIGSGGMGEIFRATDEELGRIVAVKVLGARYAADEGLRARFKREALAAARLSSNPNIVTIFDVDEHEGRPLIVMEYLPGGSLEARIKGAALSPPAQVLAWLEDAAQAIDAAHEAGVVHRDIKPGNLLLDAHGHVHVADFGVASAAGLDSFTQTGTILGTAGYLSPEQARGERASGASDLYSLAIVAWELLTGHRPYEADSPTAEAAAHVTAPIPSAHAANPALPATLDPVFRRALAKDPSHRYGSAAELVGDLRRGLHDDAGDTWARPAPAIVRRSSHRPTWWIPAGLVLLVALGALIAVLATRGGSHASAPPTVVRTITSPGTTVEQTVTAPPATTPATTPAPGGDNGAALNDAGYAKLQAGDYNGALPLLQQAVQKLQGSGQLDEAYADYNLAYTLYALGQCGNVMPLLDRAQSIEGPKKAIDQLRKRAGKCH